MYITKIEAENFRAFKSLKAEFKQKFTILCGGNGSGKSSILYTIAHGLVMSGNESGLAEDSWVHLFCKDRKGESMEIGFGTGSFEYNSYRNSKCNISVVYAEQGSDIIYSSRKLYKDLSPLFIGPNRNITYRNILGMEKEYDCDTNRKFCLDNAMAKLSNDYSPDIKQCLDSSNKCNPNTHAALRSGSLKNTA
ncbi:MAG: energy-coupling factor transporter ATP-binding protein EcfA2 [Phenylobacterium sp.]|jgi:energy-coupling factor transporter ATP-binding protein EcfA2